MQGNNDSAFIVAVILVLGCAIAIIIMLDVVIKLMEYISHLIP